MPRSLAHTAVRLVAGTALAMAPLAATLPASATSGQALVTVVHGIPDTPVDVYVDGAEALSDFTFQTVTDPIPLPAGDHEIEVRPAGAAASTDPILEATATLAAGDNTTIVANLTADGAPALTPFANPATAVPGDMGRLVVRHTAAAPAVDVLAGGTAVISNLSNPDEESLMVPAGTVEASVAAAGTTEPVIGPLPIELGGGSTTIVYAIGSLEAGNITAVTQTYDNDSASPTGVAAGSGGQAADSTNPALAVTLVAGGALLLTASTLRSRRRATASA
jgi:hypothetical protein